MPSLNQPNNRKRNNRIYYLRGTPRVVFNPKNGNYYLGSGDPLVCIVSKFDKEAGTVKYGYAILHPEEDMSKFSKFEGKKEAYKKLKENPLVVNTNATTGHELNKSVIKHFAETVGKKNSIARKFANIWLRVAEAKSSLKEGT